MDNLIAKTKLFFLDFDSAESIGDRIGDNRTYIPISMLRAMQAYFMKDLKQMIVIIIELCGVDVSYFSSVDVPRVCITKH